jgi:hypothetical protein
MSLRTLAIAPLLAALALPAAGEGLAAPYLEPALLESLQDEGELRSSLGGGAQPSLVPQIPRRAEIIEDVRKLDPSVGVELLEIYPGRGYPLDTPEALLELYNLMHAVSRMKGLEYYSASRKRMRTLFQQSYTIAEPSSRTPVPDPTFTGEIPPVDRTYLFQEDLTFGGNVYSADYFCDGQVLALRTLNLTPMHYLGIPIVHERESLTWICLIPFGDRILFYGLACARPVRFFGLERSSAREESFYNRLKAIYRWYTESLGR